VKLLITVSLAAGAIFAATQLTVFVIQPIGAIPEGRTVILWRLDSMKFIDSPDAWCKRRMGGVNVFCRGAVLAQVAKEGVIIARLPYSEALYLWSTGGYTFSD